MVNFSGTASTITLFLLYVAYFLARALQIIWLDINFLANIVLFPVGLYASCVYSTWCVSSVLINYSNIGQINALLSLMSFDILKVAIFH